MASRKHIPRGCRTTYIPGLTDESKTLYEAYQEQYRCNPLSDGTIDTGNKGKMGGDDHFNCCCCCRPTPPACSCGGVRQPNFSREALPGVSST